MTGSGGLLIDFGVMGSFTFLCLLFFFPFMIYMSPIRKPQTTNVSTIALSSITIPFVLLYV